MKKIKSSENNGKYEGKDHNIFVHPIIHSFSQAIYLIVKASDELYLCNLNHLSNFFLLPTLVLK